MTAKRMSAARSLSLALVLLALAAPFAAADASSWKPGRVIEKACMVGGKTTRTDGACGSCGGGVLAYRFAALCDGAEQGTARGFLACNGRNFNAAELSGLLRGDAAMRLSKVSKACLAL